MNLIDGCVTKVWGEPYYVYSFDNKWWAVDVEYVSWGRPGTSTLTFKTKEEADKVVEGYHFLT